MTRLLLNTDSVPLYTESGAPIPPGGIVTSDELGPEHDGSAVLVHVKPSELPQDPDASLLSQAAREHLAGNADAPVRDDAGVKANPSKGGKS